MELINNIQKKIYESLSRKYTVTDVPEETITLPFIRIAECDYSSESAKGSRTKSYDINQEIHIWSDYEGKREVNAIMEDVENILENINYEYNTICNYCLSKNVVDLEGYKQGILVFDIKIDE